VTDFSATNDAMEGFRLIGRRPGAVAVWVLLWLLLAMGPIILGFALLAPHLGGMIADMRDMPGDGAGAFSRMLRFQAALWSFIGPWMLWVLVVQSIFDAAIFRAVLEPRPQGLAGLKLGMDEVRLFLLRIILVVLWMAYLCLLTGLGVAAFIAASHAPNGVGGWLDALAVLILVCLAIYAPIRLCLAAPMTLAKGRIDPFGSWRKTRGRFWPLVGMICIIFVFMVVIGVVVAVLRNVAMLGFGWPQLQALQQLGDDPRTFVPAALRLLGPGLIAMMTIQGVATALMRVIAAAPFAAVYRDLSGAAGGQPVAAYDMAPEPG
jgi:hypothetical protein